jgi:hypothetical protein
VRILITNKIVDTRTGTEIVVRDLALALQRRGHETIVYASILGGVAREIAAAGIATTDDLSTIADAPDIIHGQHHAQVVEALLHFPDVPAIYVCHDATARVDEPFYFPRILRYVAVDLRCRGRVESVAAIPRERISVIENAVDITRFTMRPPLPARPKRALVFSNSDQQLPSIKKACLQEGVTVDAVGAEAGIPVAEPESVLPAYDLVFAKARCALEAMTVGCAVVLCDFAGVGPMVTSKSFDELRRMNFGRGVLTQPLKPEILRREIARYNAEDAAAVCVRARAEAGLQSAVAQWERLYESVIAEFGGVTIDRHAEELALADYLRHWSYESRIRWEYTQIDKLRRLPVLGNKIAEFTRSALTRWARRQK